MYFRCTLRSMDFRDEVERVVQACTSQLKGLTEAALADGDFDSVIYVSTVLKRLSNLPLGPATDLEARGTVHADTRASEGDNPSPPVQQSHDAKVKPRTKNAYPRFRRDGSYLVKVGWSKKSRQEYEHRALADVVLAIAAGLDDRAIEGRTVSADELAPATADGQEIPSYQLYLALAWLRSERLLNRIGRKGYTSAAPGELAAKARERWEEMAA